MKKESKGNQLLWIVAGAFALQIAVWTAWLIFAGKNKPTEVPLEYVHPKSVKRP